MKHNSFFTEMADNDKNIKNIKDFVIKELYIDVNCKKYIKHIDAFIGKHKLKEYDKKFAKLIIYNYWIQLLLYKKQLKLDNSFSHSTLWNFCLTGVRILEFTIYLLQINKPELINLFFSSKDVENNELIFFNHFKNLKIENNLFSVKHIQELKNRLFIIINQTEFYRSTIKIQGQKESSQKEEFFHYYFKLQDIYVVKIYNVEERKTNIKKKNHKGSKDKKIPFQEISIADLRRFSHQRYSHNTLETKLEHDARSKNLPSILFSTNIIELDKNIAKYDISSPFKQYQINRAISNSIAKNNMNLISNYNIPDIKILSIFVKNLLNSMAYRAEIRLIYISIILGISVEKLLYALLEQDKDIKYFKTKRKLSILISKGIFASTANNDINRKAINKNVDLFLPPKIIDYINFIKRNLIDNISKKITPDNLEAIINKEVESISSILQGHIKKFQVHIVLNIRTLPKLSLQYFKIFNKCTDMSLLFVGTISKSDMARVCYVSQKKRLYALESWINCFMNIINGQQQPILGIPTYDDTWIGSPIVVAPSTFKNFVLDLGNIEDLEPLYQVNMQMIFLRYALSILLATRYFINSCNLYNYSRREKLLILQEKNKNLHSSKRLIPLSDRAIKYIELFYDLKSKYKIESFSPVLLKKKNNKIYEENMKKANILEFIESINLDNRFNFIKEFISKSSLNFGRHIFSTYAATSNIKLEHIDAFMNHFKFGLVDQGIYSNFNNQKYIKEILELMQTIEKNYFTPFSKIEEIVI